VILFLHGSGEAGYGGADLAKVEGNTLARMIKAGKGLPADFPFIVLMPQCPPDQYWSPYDLIALLDDVRQKYRVDDDRVYLTGLSLGGYGVWDTAMAFPERFAAIAPVCGAGDPGDVARIRQVPAWVFHGQRDPTVPVYEAHRMVDALHAIGGDPRLTIYPDAGHDAWTRVYHDPDLYRWFLGHSRVHCAARVTPIE
jgi:predicted peptidase